MNRILRLLAFTLVAFALILSAGMLANDSTAAAVRGRLAEAISAFALLAVGFAFVLIQMILRPAPQELLKNLLLAATFLLWGIVQLMRQNLLSKTLGDVVIALYVTDLAWTIFASLASKRNRLPSPMLGESRESGPAL